MFSITGFYHRYFSHRSFRTSRPVQFVFAALGNMSAQRGPLWWAAHHRHHHRTADTPEDPHSPRQHGILWSHMGWFLTKGNFRADLSSVKGWSRFPELVFLDRFDVVMPLLLLALLFGVGEWLDARWPGLGTSGMQLVVWGGVISTLVTIHATLTINSLSHVFGRQRYNTGDDSRNNVLLAFLTLGEGWHNNHHHYPVACRQGIAWWEVDITYYLLRLMAVMRLVWDIHPVPEKVVARDLARRQA
jgi:stearoyl-CoA desaturase (delta-9 desaturase)